MRRISIYAAMIVVLIMAVAAVSTADEGMWPLYALKNLDFDALRARGLELGP